MKNIYHLGILALRAVANASVGIIAGNFAAYGVSSTQSDEYLTAYANYDTMLANAEEAKAVYHAAIQAQNEAHDELLATMAGIWATISRNPSVTDSMIAAAGFTPLDRVRSVIVPTTVADLIAEPHSQGTVKLKWNRSGNVKGTAFIIETLSPGSETWTYAAQTTKTKIMLPHFPPGVPAQFRILTQHGSQTAHPSSTVAIYPPTPTESEFREAA